MTHRLYEQTRRQSDYTTAAVVLFFVVYAIARALADAWLTAIALAAVGAAFALWRLVRGPSVGRAVIEITDAEVVFTLPFYIPTRVLRFPLERIRSLRVFGPRPGRRWQLKLDDGSREVIRPFFGPLLEPRAVDFLRAHLPLHVSIIEDEPAGILAQMRGDYRDLDDD